jgi:phosphoribosylformylglycinamidine (FGAM) synthase-like enzyme
VNAQIRGFDPLAISFFMQSASESPQEIDPYLSALKKSAKLFGVPVANNCVVPGDENLLTLFIISKKSADALTPVFQHEGDFICLLGDPNGVLKGSAYANLHGMNDPHTPPGVMAGTLAALVDVVKECKERHIISSASMIARGGLINTLCEGTSGRLGASIYSERKGPEQVFIFGEPQACAMVTIKEKHLIDLARITSNYNLTSTTIGRVTKERGVKVNNTMLIA